MSICEFSPILRVDAQIEIITKFAHCAERAAVRALRPPIPRDHFLAKMVEEEDSNKQVVELCAVQWMILREIPESRGR